MTNTILKSEIAVNIFNPTLLSLFAKASYLKNSNNGTLSTQDAIDTWVSSEGFLGWTEISSNNGVNGFQAIAAGLDTDGDGIYDEVVIAYRGSNSLLDWSIDDFLIALSQIPIQKNGAISFYNSVKGHEKVSKTANIVLTGHSLGGALAQLVAVDTNESAITFNAPGMAQQTGGTGYNNVVNYVNFNDFIGCYRNHVGETRYYLPTGVTNGSFAPHSDYYEQDFSKYITLPSGVEWTYEHAAALWGYDVNNEHSFQEIAVSGFVKESKLKEAISILQKYFKDSEVIEGSFRYEVPSATIIGDRKVYIIGSSESETFSGKSKNDVIFGNGGDDTITGEKGNDILIGGTGSDEIYGDSGNDILIAGETTLTVEQLEALRNNYNNIFSTNKKFALAA